MKNRKMIKVNSLLAMCLAVTPSLSWGFSQFDNGGSAKAAWEDGFKLNSKTRIKLNFKNANIDMILSFISKESGITIVKDPALKDPFTLQSAGSVSLDEAYTILNTTLGLKNYQLVKQGNLLVVKQKDGGGGGFPNIGGIGSGFPGGTSGQFPGFGQNQTELRVYPIKYANATEVARVLNDVFSPTPGTNNNNNNNPFRGFGNRGGQPAANIQLDANALAQLGRTPQVRASSDDFSNSVIVNATSRDQEQVQSILGKIDTQTDQPTQSRVFHLKYATASDLVSVVQNVLVTNAPKGRGGQGNQTVPFGQQIGAAIRTGSAQSAFGQVVADNRTNSLIVSATDDNLKVVDNIIAKLDTKTEIQNTTFVFQLANAKADSVAALFLQAFGNRQGLSGGGFNQNQTTVRGVTTRQPATNIGTTNTRAGAQNLTGPSPALASIDPQSNIPVALQDPTQDSGQLLTTVSAQGGGFGGFGGGRGGFGGGFGGGGTNQSSQTTSRDSNGQLVNTRDLSGQITVIPDVNTNSVIVVTAPDNLELVKSILDQLDRLPEQVMIQTVIIEANLDKTDQYGVEYKLNTPGIFRTGSTGVGQVGFGLQGAATTAASTNAPTGFTYTLSGGDLSAFLQALNTTTKFDVLSTPRIYTSNNNQAVINISQSIPYIQDTVVNSLGNLSYTYGFENVGIVLTVTPRITSNGYVAMDIDQTANDLQGYTTFNAPIVNQREANTSVSVLDGNTVVLGGIIRNSVTATINKVPILGDIPFLGQFFRSTNKEDQKTELLIFLQPHIIKDAKEAEELKKKTIQEVTPRTQKTINDILNSGSVVNGVEGASPAKSTTPAAPTTPAKGSDGHS